MKTYEQKIFATYVSQKLETQPTGNNGLQNSVDKDRSVFIK